jgi:hypothetical protein
MRGGRRILVGLLVAGALTACKDKEDEHRKFEVDSMAMARAAGKTDLSNPEMGSKVLVRLFDDSVTLSHQEIPRGQVTFAVENHGTHPHVAKIEGPGINAKSMAIAPGEMVAMAMLIDPGEYALAVADSGAAKAPAGHIKVIETIGAQVVTPVKADSAKKQ